MIAFKVCDERTPERYHNKWDFLHILASLFQYHQIFFIEHKISELQITSVPSNISYLQHKLIFYADII